MEWFYTILVIVTWDLLRTWLVVYLTAKKVKKDREERDYQIDEEVKQEKNAKNF